MTILKHILAPTDLSPNSIAAINYACDLADESNSTLHLLHVTPQNQDDVDRQVEKFLRIGSMLDARSELAIETVKKVATGRPDKLIPEYVREHDIDLVVMGTHGRSGLAHLTMGSVTENVVREAPCPVLVLGPHDGENVTLERAAHTLAEIIGDGLQADLEEGRGQLLKKLVEKIRVPSTTAIMLFDEMENREWVEYVDGTWKTVEGVEYLDASQPFVPDLVSDTQAVDLVKRARKLRATDIHVDPTKAGDHIVRLRIDGRLREYCRMNQDVAHHLINQFKTLARLDIADPFHAQEGRLHLPSSASGLEVRMTAVPVTEGQAVALRLFDPEKIFMPLDHLGFNPAALSAVEAMLHQGEGLVLVTGPTGTGKTTTVYSMLETIREGNQNIVSIEDPVEFAAPFVRQISVDVRHGLTMTEGLRTILRMDPDILFVGEIRDPETAEISMRAASSGKYVFSTMHTRDIASTITALRDLNLTNRSLASNLTGIVNQRLVLRLCPKCKQAEDVSPKQQEHFQSLGVDVPEVLYSEKGCIECSNTGHRGRIGVFEVSQVHDELAEAIANNQPAHELVRLLRSTGSDNLQQDAMRKAAAGLISYEKASEIHWLV